MQTFVFPTVFYIWKVLLICRGGYHPPASKDTNIVIEINYINITKLLLFCRGEPCSPVRVRCTRLHAMRAKLNKQFILYQNICVWTYKFINAGGYYPPLRLICVCTQINWRTRFASTLWRFHCDTFRLKKVFGENILKYLCFVNKNCII